jgi:hypothetical protein
MLEVQLKHVTERVDATWTRLRDGTSETDD